ncbi:MAG: tRNA pseudouridine(38-40) synthase TruA [Pyrinomonadaceae bacterium]
MQTWKLEIEYEGTRYRGWQIQQNARTVQGEIERAAKEFFDTGMLEIGGSGRTDAGVHAKSQIAHLRVFRAFEDVTPRRLQLALNDNLPRDINILRVQNAVDKFHARHDAVARYYLYQISTERTAFAKNFVWWVKDRLDVQAMNQAAKFLIGNHDFRSFCESVKEEKSTLVKVEKSQIFTDGNLICFRIGASHFLWKMVRRIVGSLVEIGRGKLSVEEFQKYLEKFSNAPAPTTAPPSGLFLEKVLYPGDAPPAKNEPLISIQSN